MTLKRTGLKDGLTGDTDVMKTLIRASGMKGKTIPEELSLTQTNSDVLAAAMERIKPFTSGNSDSESDNDDEW